MLPPLDKEVAVCHLPRLRSTEVLQVVVAGPLQEIVLQVVVAGPSSADELVAAEELVAELVVAAEELVAELVAAGR